MRFQRLDLNLLVALDALLCEKSVSRAADRICLSQSATSSALGRLRDYFNDELLVMQGRRMALTARAEELVEPVRAVLEQIQATIAVVPDFDPATAERSFAVMATDYVTEILLSQALREFADIAPGIDFEIRPPDDRVIDTLERGSIDLLITTDLTVSPEHPSQLLMEDDYVVAGWDRNPALKGIVSAEAYFRLGHITTRFGKSRVPAFEEWYLRSQSQRRNIEVSAPSFLSVPFMLEGSMRIATMQRRLAERMARRLPLAIRPMPVAIPRLRLAAQWHRTNQHDRAILWLVGELKRVADQGGAWLEGDEDPRLTVSREDLAAGFRATVQALIKS